jgi:diguanylate cyclase (GGDEF)-like protein/PAS domain S-box-containing protein
MDGPSERTSGSDSAAEGADARALRTWVRKNATAVMVDVDPAMPAILGWKSEDLVGKTSLDFIHPDDQSLAVENWMQMLTSDGAPQPARVRHRRADGSWAWVEMTNRNLLDDPADACVLAEMVDVSDELGTDMQESFLGGSEGSPSGPGARPLQMHEALRAREQLLHRLSEALPVGVLHVDAGGRVLYTNRQLHLIVGRERAGTFVEQLANVLPEDAFRVSEAIDSALRGGLDTDTEIRLQTSEAALEKEIRQCTLSIRTLSAEDGSITGAAVCLADVTDSVRMRDELRLQATFDVLTNCYNRASTMDALDMMLAAADEHGRPAVIFIDLDNFKGVNDRLGHATGDEVLKLVAARLRSAVRARDVVGRIGGDEFLVLCPDIGSPTEALRAATRVSKVLGRQLKLRGGDVAGRASVGVAWSPDADLDGDALIGQADTAMYEAKRAHLARPVLYARGERGNSEPGHPAAPGMTGPVDAPRPVTDLP